MGVILSDFGEAKKSVSKLVGIDTDNYRRHTVSISTSTVTGMVSGVTAANRILAFTFDVGAALGVGVGFKINIDIEPKKLVDAFGVSFRRGCPRCQ